MTVAGLPRLGMVLLMLLVGGCSTPDNSEPPAELTEIEKPERYRALWSVSVDSSVLDHFYKLRPLSLADRLYTITPQGVIHQVDPKTGRSDWTFRTGIKASTALSRSMN